jgi:hypothetical protein
MFIWWSLHNASRRRSYYEYIRLWHITSEGKVFITPKWDGTINNAEYAYVYFVHGFCDGNARAASREFHRRYVDRRHPTDVCLQGYSAVLGEIITRWPQQTQCAEWRGRVVCCAGESSDYLFGSDMNQASPRVQSGVLHVHGLQPGNGNLCLQFWRSLLNKPDDKPEFCAL